MKAFLKRAVGRILAPRANRRANGDGYWSRHNVTLHHVFGSAQESIDYFHWRNDQYFPYIDLMPVAGQDGKVVVDVGCGPGHDLVGFSVYSQPSSLVGIDVSTSSLAEAKTRLALHGAQATLLHIDEKTKHLPLGSGSADYIHCSGVLHHAEDPLAILREFRRVLKSGGEARIMVYNYDSLWLHLWVAYHKQLLQGAYRGLDVRQAFAKTTDGEDCPISRVYKREEFRALCGTAGFECEFLGAAVSMFELSLFPTRFGAISDRRLPGESRRFLGSLTLDERGYPRYQGVYAGVDGCYLLSPIR